MKKEKKFSRFFDSNSVNMGEDYIIKINEFMVEHEKLMALLERDSAMREQYIITLTAREYAESERAKEFYLNGFRAGFYAAKKK